MQTGSGIWILDKLPNLFSVYKLMIIPPISEDCCETCAKLHTMPGHSGHLKMLVLPLGWEEKAMMSRGSEDVLKVAILSHHLNPSLAAKLVTCLPGNEEVGPRDHSAPIPTLSHEVPGRQLPQFPNMRVERHAQDAHQ